MKHFCDNVDNIDVCIDYDDVDDIGDSDHLNADDEERKVFFSWFHHLEAGGSRGLTQFPMLDSLSLPSAQYFPPLSDHQMIHLYSQRNTLPYEFRIEQFLG